MEGENSTPDTSPLLAAQVPEEPLPCACETFAPRNFFRKCDPNLVEGEENLNRVLSVWELIGNFQP